MSAWCRKEGAIDGGAGNAFFSLARGQDCSASAGPHPSESHLDVLAATMDPRNSADGRDLPLADSPDAPG